MLTDVHRNNLQVQPLSPASTPPFFGSLIETVFLTLTGFLLGYWLLPEAPLFATQGFTWLIVGPFLSGLRYGFFHASFSIFLSLSIIISAYFYPLPWATEGSISTICLTLFWIGFISSGFKYYWEQKTIQLNAKSKYLDQQLTEITKAHSLTKISHDRLQELVVSQVSLRDTILEVRKQILNLGFNKENDYLKHVSSAILRVLSEYGDIQMASLHEVNSRQHINARAIDHIGKHKIRIDPKDPLLLEAIETRKTVSLKTQLLADKKYQGSLILAIPLADSSRKIWGIIAVYQIPFRSYHPDNLTLISTLSGYIGDLIGKQVYSSSTVIKNTELHAFILQIQRCILDLSSYNIPSSILSLEFKDNKHYKILEGLLLQRKRGLDQSWSSINRHGSPVLCFLMPLTSILELEPYKSDILKSIQEHYNFSSFQAAGILVHQTPLSPDDSVADVIDHLAEQLQIKMSEAMSPAERGFYVSD